MGDNFENSKMPKSRMRKWVSALATLVTIGILALVFLTDFPWWAGLLTAAVILVPCQIYLNKSKSEYFGRKRS